MPIKESVTLDETIAFLNELVKLDAEALGSLVETRVPCNNALAHHATVQVNAYEGKCKYKVGLLGILNGLFGTDDKGWGGIAASFDVVCPNSGMPVEDLRVEESCPDCGAPLILGPLTGFIKPETK
jgi:hypothetical protein